MIFIPSLSTTPSETLLAFKVQRHESDQIFARQIFQETSKEHFHWWLLHKKVFDWSRFKDLCILLSLCNNYRHLRTFSESIIWAGEGPPLPIFRGTSFPGGRNAADPRRSSMYLWGQNASSEAIVAKLVSWSRSSSTDRAKTSNLTTLKKNSSNSSFLET